MPLPIVRVANGTGSFDEISYSIQIETAKSSTPIDPRKWSLWRSQNLLEGGAEGDTRSREEEGQERGGGGRAREVARPPFSHAALAVEWQKKRGGPAWRHAARAAMPLASHLVADARHARFGHRGRWLRPVPRRRLDLARARRAFEKKRGRETKRERERERGVVRPIGLAPSSRARVRKCPRKRRLRDHRARARAHASSVSRLGGELGFVFSFLILCHDNLDTIADGLSVERRG